MAYDKHTWNTKEAITKSKMQHIEDGIAALDTQQTTNTQNISTLNTKLGEIVVNQGGTVADRLSSLSGDIATLQNAVGSQSSVTSRLKDVETAITNAKGSSDTLQIELMRIENESKQRDNTLTDNVGTATSKAETAQTTANNAIGAINAAKGTSNSLQERIDGIADTNTSQDTAIGTLQGRLNSPTGNNTTMEQNFSTIYSDVGGIKSEIQTARGVDNLNEPRENLNARFVDDEARLTSAEGRLTSLETSTGTTLPTRIGAVESRIGTAEGKITAIETEINGAHREGIVDDTLDARFDAVEATANAAAVAATVNTALDELDGRLNAIDGGSALDTTNGTLASRVSAAENAISHAADAGNSDPGGLTERLTAAEGSIDNIESSIGSGFDSTNTVMAAINAKANSSDMATALAGKVATSDFTTAINNLTAKDTVVISAPVSGSNYTNNEPNLQDPSSDCDYLIEDDNGKYFYWRYIDNEWKLISGAGGGGSGNTTGIDLTANEYQIIKTNQTYAKNTDYYVLEADNIRHHYRYIDAVVNNEQVLIEIEIGIVPNQLKSYQIARSEEIDTSTNESTQYLDLYRFDFGTNVTPDNVDTIPNYESYRIAHLELPKGGGGEGGQMGGHRIYAKVRGDQSQRISWTMAQNTGVRINYGYTCYSYDTVDGFDYVSATATLTDQNNNVIETYNIPYLTYDQYTEGAINITTKNLLQYCQKNNTQSFTLTLHAVNAGETITDKVLTVYITLVELALTSTFSDQQTYSITNNLTIPYQFTGMSDQSPEFEILLDGNSTVATITNTNIIIRKEQLANKKGVHNLTIRASQLVGGSTLYSEPLTYQLGLVSGTDDNLMLFSGLSLQTLYNEQYQLLKLPYYLYVPNNESIEVSFTSERVTYDGSNNITNRESVQELYRPSEILSTGAYYYNFRLHDMVADIEYYIITIHADNQNLIFSITVNKADEQINIKTDNLVFDFKPERYSNNIEDLNNRLWSETNNGVTYKMRIPEGAHFDWRTGGWMTINDVPCFCVKAGSRVEFVQDVNGTVSPLTLFWPDMEEQGGSNFKCTFKIDNVKTPNTPFLTSLDTVTNTIINYGKLILSSKQDLEDDDTLLHSYINTKYIYTTTINSSNKVVKEAISQTVLNTSPFDGQLTAASCVSAAADARNSNKKKIKKYISNIYDIANQASVSEHREYLLKVLAGKSNDSTIDYSTIKNEITNYLFDETLYDASTADNTNASNVYNRLVEESNNTSTVTYAYRQVEPINFDALLNGFIVEGKDGKDGIIAMILFTFNSIIKTGGAYTQTVSAQPISTNSFSKTGTFEVEVTDTVNNETKTYEVEMLDENTTGTYTEIVSIRDASNKETRAYGLELNALGSNIYLPSGVVSYAHSEGDIIEFEYNVNPEITGRVNSSIVIYEDGVPSAAKLYTSRNDIFEQRSPGCLTIGSDECDVYIYKMRLYNQALNNEDILANFYADGLTTDDMMERYNRNKNLVNAQTITPQLVATECPDLRVIMIEAPNLTGGKTSFIKNTKIRQIYKNGRPEDNWVALNAYHAGQGTSSDNYGVAGRNLDIIFGFDGVDTVIIPKPQKNNYTFDPTYKSILIKGLDEDLTNDILTAEEYENAGYTVEYNGTGKVSFTEDSVPNNWFNIKVNIASSENTNNAFLQKRFDRYLPYETPAMKRDERIKNDMEFFNCVVFIKETGTPSEFTEDKDLAANARPWHFYGIGNIGDSKKTDATRVNVVGDPYEFCVEISDNGLKNSGFSSGVYYISEQSKIRSQTPRNQANGNMDLDVIRTATSIHVCTQEEYIENNSVYTFNINNPSSTVLYLIGIASEAFTYYRRFMYVSSTWTEIGEPITFTRTSYGIKYPVAPVEWDCSLNDYHKSLYDTTSGKGWDKSFEFRYDITTKDGETVARNDLEAAMNSLHQQANKKAYADMYSWIVTATNADFHTNLDQWFIAQSPLYWYLFTERYTMIDSRAKNTFYHYGKVYISQAEYNGEVKTGLENANAAEYAITHNIADVKDGNNNVLISKETIAEEEIAFKLTAATFIYNNRDTFILDNAQAAINDGYRFELWDYDNDTALGINNNGQMVFSAGLEDVDKDISGWIYNEAESVFWRRIRENMYDELGALYVQLKGQCFNAENLIQEFDNCQAQFPEELWRLDFERKYYRPFIEKGETTYLNDMANGRKRYQRRQFERNMAIYINSKYQRNGSYDPTDIISFRPQFEWTAGRDTRITIKPYSTMYINFMLGNDDNTGNDTVVSTRVERGSSYTINAADYIHDFNNIQCIIYNASRIMELDGLGNFECKQFILGAAKKLSVLKLGSADYPNRSMQDINNMGLSDGLPLLEELDLTNIQFGTAPDTFALDNFPLLKKLNATGCNIRSFTFKDGGMLEKIIFPAVLTRIDFKNLYNLIDTQNNNELELAVTLTGAANLISYNSINSYSNSYQIVQNMLNNAGLNNITELKLNDINWTIDNITDLEPLTRLQTILNSNMLLQGEITITGNWSQVKLDNYSATFGAGNIVWHTDSSKEIAEYKLTFYLSLEDQLNHNPYYISYLSVEEGELDTVLGDDPAYINLCPIPQKAATVSKSYFFGANKNQYLPWSGWRFINSDSTPRSDLTIDENMELVAIFGEEARTYPLRWYLNENDAENNYVYEVLNIPYNSSYETGLAPSVLDLLAASKTTAQLNPDANHTYKIFKGWKKQPNNLDSTYLNNDQTAFCIYGDWEEGTESINAIKSQAQLDEKKLLVLTNTNDSSSILPTSSTYTVEMGYDNSTGTTIVGKNASLGIGPRGNAYTGESIESPILSFEWYNGGIVPTIRPVNDIKPFTNMSTDGFTLAIDYQVDTTYARSVFPSGYCIIGGCYFNDNNISQGFALYYDINSNVIKVCFGNLAVQNTYSSSTSSRAITNPASVDKRNIVVIRHQPGSNTLQFYSGISGTAGMLLSLDDDSFRQEITWSNNNATSPLCFGHFTTSTFSALAAVHPGVGASIHWAKYWEQDLGHNECTLLASWPHETITFALSDYSNDGNTDILVTNSKNLIFSALQLSQYSGPIIQSIQLNSGNTVSWGNILKSNSNSTYKQIANQRFFLGLPTKLQAIASKTIGHAALITDNYNFYHVYEYTTTNETVDLAFLPTYYEVGGDRENYQSEALRSLPWYTGANTRVYTYGTSNFDFNTYSNNAQYMNLRFPGIPIKSISGVNNVFIGYAGSDPVYNKINIQNNPNGGIMRGDIFIHTYTSNNNTTTVAYIYADESDKAAGAPIIKAVQGDLLYCELGGWIPAGSWWTRTPADTNGEKAVGSQPFFYIDGNTGAISYNSTPAENGAYFIYEFGI